MKIKESLGRLYNVMFACGLRCNVACGLLFKVASVDRIAKQCEPRWILTTYPARCTYIDQVFDSWMDIRIRIPLLSTCIEYLCKSWIFNFHTPMYVGKQMLFLFVGAERKACLSVCQDASYVANTVDCTPRQLGMNTTPDSWHFLYRPRAREISCRSPRQDGLLSPSLSSHVARI